MRQSGAKWQISAKLERWCVQWRKDNPRNARPKGSDAFFLFCVPELEAKNSPLLNFRVHDDKWQEIHSWLRQAGLVSRGSVVMARSALGDLA